MAIKYWFNGLPVTSQSAGQPIGSLDYWFAGMPLPVLIPAALDLETDIVGVSATGAAGTTLAFVGTIGWIEGVGATCSVGLLDAPMVGAIEGVQASAQTLAAPATLDPSDMDAAGMDLSSDLLTFAVASGGSIGLGSRGIRATTSHLGGKNYFEVTIGSGGSLFDPGVGIRTKNSVRVQRIGAFWLDSNPANIYIDGNLTGYQLSGLPDTGDCICVAVDLANKLGWIRLNDDPWNGSVSADPATGVNGVDLSGLFSTEPAYPFVAVSASGEYTFNFGATAFSHTVPSGFTAWNDYVDVIEPAVAINVPNASATGYAGTVSIPVPGLNVNPVGVSATGEAGTFEFTGNIGLTGVTATCVSGDFTSAVARELEPTVATGALGTLIGQQTQLVDLDGNEATTATGDLFASISGARNGATGTGRAGTIHTYVDHAFSCASATATTGYVIGNPGGQMQQVEGIGGVGDFAIDIAFGVIVTGVVGHAGTGHAGIGDGIDGNLCYGQSGLMRAKPGANLYSVPMLGRVGSFSFDATKNIPGAVSVGYIGNMVGGIPQPLIGVEATGYVDPIGRILEKTLTGVVGTGIAQAFTNVYLFGNGATTEVGTFDKTITEYLQAVQASAQLGELRPDLLTPRRYYLTAQSNFGSLVVDTAPPTTVHTTGWWVARNSAGLFGIMKYNVEQHFNILSGVSQLTQAPTAINGNSWRSYGVLNGLVDAGTWTMQVALRALDNASGQSGRIRLRVYKSANSNGTSPVEITDGAQVGTITGPLSTSSDSLSIVTFTIPQVAIDNEYLFFEVEWEITSAASAQQADIHVTLGANSYVMIPIMAVTAGVDGVASNGSVGIIYIDEQKPFEGVTAIGQANNLAIGRAAMFMGVEAVCDHGVFDLRIAKPVNGVSGIGLAGDAHSQISLIGSISLVGANGNGFAGDMGVPLYWPLDGNEAMGEVGNVFGAVDAIFEGVEGVCETNDIVPAKNVIVALDSIDGVGAAGNVSGAYDIQFDGVSAFTIVGNMSPDLRSLLEGIFGIGFAGPVTKSPDVATDIPGTGAFGDVGEFNIYETVTVEGVQASAQSSELPFELTSLLDAVTADGEIGLIDPEVDYYWQGTQATGFVARLHPNSAIMDGAGGIGRAGKITVSSRSRGVAGRLLPRLVKTEYGNVLWYDNASQEP